ncbi:MAG: hypothetical protein ABIJ38_01400 [Patescibacteria group bacterium]
MPEEVFETPQPQPKADRPLDETPEQKSTNWTKIILAAVLGLGLLAGVASAGYYYGTQQTQKTEGETGNSAVYGCKGDEDCVLVKDGCCGCTAGGRNTVTNKGSLDLWNKRLLEECVGIACPMVMSDHWTCFAKPACVGGECQLLEAPAVEDETEDWKTYTNAEYGYKVSYPGQLTVKEQTSDIFLHQVSFESSPASYLTGFIVEVKEGGNIANEVEYRKWQIVGHVADKVKNESAIDVAGYQGVRLDYEVTGSVPEDKKEFGTVILTNGKYTYTIKANATLLPQVLLTFKFFD